MVSKSTRCREKLPCRGLFSTAPKSGQFFLTWSNKSGGFIKPLLPKLLFLKFHGVYIPQREMTAPAVVKHLDVIDDILPGSRSTEVPHSKNLLNFEAAKKTLGHSIVPTIAFSAHAAQYPMIFE